LQCVFQILLNSVDDSQQLRREHLRVYFFGTQYNTLKAETLQGIRGV